MYGTLALGTVLVAVVDLVGEAVLRARLAGRDASDDIGVCRRASRGRGAGMRDDARSCERPPTRESYPAAVSSPANQTAAALREARENLSLRHRAGFLSTTGLGSFRAEDFHPPTVDGWTGSWIDRRRWLVINSGDDVFESGKVARGKEGNDSQLFSFDGSRSPVSLHGARRCGRVAGGDA